MSYEEFDADTGVSGMRHRKGGADHGVGGTNNSEVGGANNNGVGGASDQHNHYDGDSSEYISTPLDTHAHAAARASRHPENYGSEMYSLILILSMLYFYFIYISNPFNIKLT